MRARRAAAHPGLPYSGQGALRIPSRPKQACGAAGGAYRRGNRWWVAILLGVGLLLASCGNGNSGGSTASGASSTSSGCTFAPRAGVFADRVVSYNPVNSTSASPAQWPYFFQPQTVLGPPCGDDANAGGQFDGISLGYDPSAADALGGTVVLGFGDSSGHRCVVHGTAPDFAVYGNEFQLDSPNHVYNKIATVAVAQNADGPFYEFPPAYSSDPSHADLRDPQHYVNFAGVMTTAAGGDRFDLAVVQAAYGLLADFQACYLELQDGGTRWPDYGNTQTDQYAGGAAIDAAEALHSAPAP